MTQRSLPTRLRTSLVLACLFVASCSDGGEAEPAVEAVEVLESDPLPFVSFVTEQDVGQARASFDIARGRWAETGPDSYRLVIGNQLDNAIEIQVVDGTVSSIDNDVAGVFGIESMGPAPTVEDVFATVEALIRPFEEDPSLVPSPDECGQHFNVSFDQALGYPDIFDALGPCDDGVSISVEVFAK